MIRLRVKLRRDERATADKRQLAQNFAVSSKPVTQLVQDFQRLRSGFVYRSRSMLFTLSPTASAESSTFSFIDRTRGQRKGSERKLQFNRPAGVSISFSPERDA